MFLHVFSIVGMATGFLLIMGAGSSWLRAPYWSLVGIVLADLSYFSLVPYHGTSVSHSWIALTPLCCVIITTYAVHKFNTLKAKQEA